MSHDADHQDRMQAPPEDNVDQASDAHRRRITSVILAGAVLVALAMAIGIELPGLSGGASNPSTETARVTSSLASQRQASLPVQGTVTASVRHIGRHTWRFVYTVRNTGKTPIAGFELNTLRSNLFHIAGKRGWTDFGSGICGSRYGSVLVYWSTGRGGPFLSPKRTARFGFTVHTSGPKPVGYSLSWDAAPPRFGTVLGPAPSSLPATGSCDR